MPRKPASSSSTPDIHINAIFQELDRQALELVWSLADAGPGGGPAAGAYQLEVLKKLSTQRKSLLEVAQALRTPPPKEEPNPA